MLFTDPQLALDPDIQFTYSRSVYWGPISHDLRLLGPDLLFLAQGGSPTPADPHSLFSTQGPEETLKNASGVMALLSSEPCQGPHFTLNKSQRKA